MSHRRAKRIRQALFPFEQRARLDNVLRTRVSVGRFLRSTTDYTVSRTQLVLKPGCPRQVYQRVKEKARG